MTTLADRKPRSGLFGKGKGRAIFLVSAVTLAITAALSSWNIAREEGKDAAVRGNIDTILTQVRYGTATGTGVGCTAGIFNDANIAAALDAIRTANNGGSVRCVAGSDGYAVSAARPSLGFFRPETPYWCGDASHASCAADTEPSSTAPACTCATP